MQVYVNDFGERIVPPYSVYVDRQEEARNVSLMIPESSTNVGLYDFEQVNHLTGNSEPGMFTDESALANYWWGLRPYNEKETKSYAATLPDVASTPRNTFLNRPFVKSPYKRLKDIYG
jgi:hypothetical protein